MRLIDADALYERICDLEAQALSYVGKIGNDEAMKEDWRIWSAILAERTAFKHDVFDAPTIEPEPQWIPCSEAVPATEDKVLCQTITKKGVVNFVIGYHTENFGWACGMNSNVLAWMPLPEPYREDTDGDK